MTIIFILYGHKSISRQSNTVTKMELHPPTPHKETKKIMTVVRNQKATVSQKCVNMFIFLPIYICTTKTNETKIIALQARYV